MSRTFRTVDDSELEDFDTECRAYGLDPKEFQMKEDNIVETPKNTPTFSTNAKLTITRKGVSRIYNTGNATHWVADFAEDLRKGIFS